MKYIYDLVVQVFLVLVVIYLFQTNPNKIVASFWAGALFVLLPSSMMMREWLFFKKSNKVWWLGAIQFLVLFAIPIFVLRVLNPHVSLETLEPGGEFIKVWHRLSNLSYCVFVGVTIYSIWMGHKTQKTKN